MIIGLMLMLGACTQHASGGAEEATNVVLDRKLPTELNNQMDGLLKSYLAVKDLLVAGDSVKAGKAAREFVGQVSMVDGTLIPQADQARWGFKQKDLLKYGLGTSEAPTLAAQRKQFELLGNTLYLVLTEIGAGTTKVYRQYCPMAFDNTGAYWLSDVAEIRNPYFGDMMLECGTVKEVLTFKQNP